MQKLTPDRNIVAGLLMLPLVAACGPSQPQTELQKVLASGELRVLTRNAATTYYEGPDGGPTGLEYELAKGFADKLGVKLKLVVAPNVGKVLQHLAEGKADFAAASLTVTKERKKWLRFTPPYRHIKQQLIYRLGTPKPDTLDDIDGHLEVLADSTQADCLENLKQEHPELSWSEKVNADSEALLTGVWEKSIDYTVASSSEVALSRRFYPELRVAFDVTDRQPVAWAFPKTNDKSLYEAASDYFTQLRSSGKLARLIERNYGNTQDFDYVGNRIYRNHIQERLPKYKAAFEQEAADNDLDWRLLAAVAYQESHWNARAVSPTGVRGIMMLTQATAKHLGIKRRTDPMQSIKGGAQYLRRLLDKIPDRIQGPDRVWLALTAYNLGFMHLEDARILTQQQGGNPDRWLDVRERLPLLRHKAWYKQTEHGYARGDEAVQYVENIRKYYDVLVWLTDHRRPPTPKPQDLMIASSPAV